LSLAGSRENSRVPSPKKKRECQKSPRRRHVDAKNADEGWRRLLIEEERTSTSEGRGREKKVAQHEWVRVRFSFSQTVIGREKEGERARGEEKGEGGHYLIAFEFEKKRVL